jgi:hypothetical protein
MILISKDQHAIAIAVESSAGNKTEIININAGIHIAKAPRGFIL